MSFLHFAKEIEQQGFDFYNHLADREQIRELAGIFRFMAKEEKKHFEMFCAWEKNVDPQKIESYEITKNAKNVFISLIGHFENSGILTIDYDDTYEKAITFEEKSIECYTEILFRTDPYSISKMQREALASTIEVEIVHAQFISSLMEYQRHPAEWSENTKWLLCGSYLSDKFVKNTET